MLINLHSHLEGRVRPSTAAELAPLAGVRPPAVPVGPADPVSPPAPASPVDPAGPDAWARALTLPGPADLTAYLAVVSSTYPFFARPEWIARIVREAVEDAAADGVAHLELRLGAVSHASVIGLDAVIGAACEGLAEGRVATGIVAGLVISALRKHPAAVNEELARAAVRHAGSGVTGFDLAGNEGKYPDLRPHAAAFAIARAGGLGLTAHAAEDGPGTAAAEAGSLFGARRIGHGTRVADDPEVMARLAGEGVVLEVCPTSNWFTGATASIDAHPARAFHAAGLRVVAGDDNPLQTGSPLSREREILRGMGFGAELDATALEVAFLSDADRRQLTDWR